MHKMPPLSFVDKLIYWFLFLLHLTLSFILLLELLHLRRVITFADISVVAVAARSGILWVIIPWLTYFLIPFILLDKCYIDRKPIFGRRNFKYGPPAWPKVYPLFMKNKPYVFVSARKKKDRRLSVIILLIVLLVSLIPLPLSLYGRNCLRDNGSIVQYNMLNNVAHSFTSEEIEVVTIKAYRYRTKSDPKFWSYGVQIELITDTGKKYPFNAWEFRDHEKNGALTWLLSMEDIKQHYDQEILRYEGVNYLDDVVADKALTNEEAQLLYRLFAQNK